ncbi:MAG: ferrochelatase, partial [Gemmatimonadales bacterium]|nr:ferrochelatase [Gemmatimonadales bacterium]
FISDHMEVMYDIDIEARDAVQRLGLRLVRASTVGVNAVFVEMLCELIAERQETSAERRAIGHLPAWHDVCPVNCCLDGRSGSGPAPLAARGHECQSSA